MTRIPILERDEMSAEQLRVFDAAKKSKGVVGGPYHAYIRVPMLFEAYYALRNSLASGPLSERENQIANLVVARHFNARYPWHAQARKSLAVGISQSVIESINTHQSPALANARESTIFVVTKELITDKGLSDETYRAAEEILGVEDLVALVSVAGSFAMSCMTANVFRMEPPVNDPIPLIELGERLQD